MREKTLETLIENLLNCIHPKCQRCKECATKMVTYTFLLGGEQYFCDKHWDIDSNIVNPGTRCMQDLAHAFFIRQAREYLDESKKTVG